MGRSNEGELMACKRFFNVRQIGYKLYPSSCGNNSEKKMNSALWVYFIHSTQSVFIYAAETHIKPRQTVISKENEQFIGYFMPNLYASNNQFFLSSSASTFPLPYMLVHFNMQVMIFSSQLCLYTHIKKIVLLELIYL